MKTKLKYSKILRILLEVEMLLLIDYWCLNRYINCFTFDWNQLAVAVLIDLFTTRHKVVHNGGSPNFKLSLFDKKTTYMAQILQSLSYKVCFITLP